MIIHQPFLTNVSESIDESLTQHYQSWKLSNYVNSIPNLYETNAVSLDALGKATCPLKLIKEDAIFQEYEEIYEIIYEVDRDNFELIANQLSEFVNEDNTKIKVIFHILTNLEKTGKYNRKMILSDFGNFLLQYFKDQISPEEYEMFFHNNHSNCQKTSFKDEVYYFSKYIPKDDVEKLQQFYSKNLSVEYDIIVKFSDLETIIQISLIDFAALNGSIKCFKYLLINNAKLTKIVGEEDPKSSTITTLTFATIGGNPEIIHHVIQQGIKPRIIDLYFSIYTHNKLLFEWYLEILNESLTKELRLFCISKEFYYGAFKFDCELKSESESKSESENKDDEENILFNPYLLLSIFVQNKNRFFTQIIFDHFPELNVNFLFSNKNSEDIITHSPEKVTPLAMAVINEDLEMIKYLLSQKTLDLYALSEIDAQILNNHKLFFMNVMEIAIFKGFRKIVEFFVDLKFDTSKPNVEVFDFHSVYQDTDLLHYLINNNLYEVYQSYILTKIICKGDHSLFFEFLNNPNIHLDKFKNENNPLVVALSQHQETYSNILFQRNDIDVNKGFPLLYCNKDEQIMRILEHPKFDINKFNILGKYIVSGSNKISFPELFQVPGIDINKYGSLALAIFLKSEFCFNQLLKIPHIDINKGMKIWNFLDCYIWKYQEPANHGLIIKNINHNDILPLSVAFSWRLPDYVKVLVNHPKWDLKIGRLILYDFIWSIMMMKHLKKCPNDFMVLSSCENPIEFLLQYESPAFQYITKPEDFNDSEPQSMNDDLLNEDDFHVDYYHFQLSNYEDDQEFEFYRNLEKNYRPCLKRSEIIMLKHQFKDLLAQSIFSSFEVFKNINEKNINWTDPNNKFFVFVNSLSEPLVKKMLIQISSIKIKKVIHP
ncbi:hypothetical protein TRFO_36387 [Tritrichomonas foetus]|uniref:DUF3447 domain-containing protein n=1 Tax=Tritrichomonas foetus TaxID=1144522 RepID=A0A1J4JGF6_9EUKA|nr:hypothetical protein TRFO_36387 [Tritrichomonas foetus]|eukprot:OHS97383.1 hypothetical protein TRFO_36387 [Tritrichomonas foetus]